MRWRSSFFGYGWATFLFLLLLALQWHNVTTYPLQQGFDATAHLEYIDFVRAHHQLPLPHTGWEFFQPPLYYVIAALLPSAINLRLIGLVSWLGLAASVMVFLKTLRQRAKPQSVFSTVAVAIGILALALPVILTITPAISNEFLSGVLISAALVYYCCVFARRRESQRAGMKLGVLIGAALLTKATALLLLPAIILDRLVATKGNLAHLLKQLAVPLAVALVVGGGFYLRSYVLYGKIIYLNSDYWELRDFAQPIVNRDAYFFTTLKGFTTNDLFAAHHYSFLAGTYFSWFYDGHGILLPVQAFSKAGSMLVGISYVFTAVAMIGALSLGKKTLVLFKKNRHRFYSPFFILPIYSALLIIAYIQYNFRLPLHSTVKGALLNSLVIPFCYVEFMGIRSLIFRARTKRTQWVIAALFLALVTAFVLIEVRHFWVEPRWYRY